MNGTICRPGCDLVDEHEVCIGTNGWTLGPKLVSPEDAALLEGRRRSKQGFEPLPRTAFTRRVEWLAHLDGWAPLDPIRGDGSFQAMKYRDPRIDPPFREY